MEFEEGEKVKVKESFSCGCGWCKSLVENGGVIVEFSENLIPVVRPDIPQSSHMEPINNKFLEPKVTKTEKTILENYDI